uniref:Retrotransposon gag domain-containing protein n=1 Tax=Amphimedon queenslandica TaxID=400682 RepID=A0A1X7U4Y2_AMPQE
MSVVRNMTKCNSLTEKFSSYFERLELYFIANRVTANKVVPVFLTVIGAKTYAILEHILALDKAKDKTLAELKEVLVSHFEPEPRVIAERFHFHKRDQKERELLPDFVVELRRLASKCQFGAHLMMLSEISLSGQRNESMQKILLMEKAFKFNIAVEKALQFEVAEVNTKAMNFRLSGEGTAVNHKESQP